MSDQNQTEPERVPGADTSKIIARKRAATQVMPQAVGDSTLCVSDLKLSLPKSAATAEARVPILLQVVENAAVARYVMAGASATLGRDPSAEISLDDGLVSRRHARVFWENSGDGAEYPRCYLVDLGSRNGTYLNHAKLATNGRDELSEGDRIQVGATLLLFTLKPKSELHYDKRLASLATIDSLTGAANRAAFTDEAERAIPRAARYDRPLCLAVLDIDHFKKVNDTYGHGAGDAVLRQVGATIMRAMRDVDVVGRIGGEEFAVLMPESTLEVAVVAANRLRETVEASTFPADGHNLKVTVSIGVAALKQQAGTWEALYKAADERLYEAKQTGRNRVCAQAETGA